METESKRGFITKLPVETQEILKKYSLSCKKKRHYWAIKEE